MKRLLFALLPALLAAFPTAAAQQADKAGHTTADGRLAPLLANLGTLHVPVTTKNADTQTYFDQGIRLLYGFNHAEALRSFREAARNDDRCAMAYWGQALALAPNINDSAIGPDREKQGYDAIRQAVKRRSYANRKEQALIDALAARFAETTKRDRKALNQAYAEAMEKVWREFPQDANIAVLYADAVMNTRPWDYWTKDGKPQPGIANARVALERAIRDNPDHPGALHIYIHLLEASDHVDLAVPAADRLGPLMPGAGHLVHMPSHVYIRVGRYADAAEANIQAVKADENYITQCRAQGIYPAGYYPHNIHFLATALVMDGRRTEALRAARKAASKHHHDVPEGLEGFANLLEALPPIVMVRFGRWHDILKRPAPVSSEPFIQAIHQFARGMAFSALGGSTQAKDAMANLEMLVENPVLEKQKILDLNSLADITRIAAAMLRGEIAQRDGRYGLAIAAYKRAADIEDGLLYSEPPDWLLPPRHYLAHAYLMAGRLADAERTYREDLRRHRMNGWSLIGLEQVLRKQGRAAEADRVDDDFKRAWSRSDTPISASRL